MVATPGLCRRGALYAASALVALSLGDETQSKGQRMSSAHDELPVAAKNEIMQLIYTDHDIKNPNKLRPVAITDVQGSNFFPWHNNRFDGYFLEVSYVDHKELWFAVDVAGEAEYNWFLERIR